MRYKKTYELWKKRENGWEFIKNNYNKKIIELELLRLNKEGNYVILEIRKLISNLEGEKKVTFKKALENSLGWMFYKIGGECNDNCESGAV